MTRIQRVVGVFLFVIMCFNPIITNAQEIVVEPEFQEEAEEEKVLTEEEFYEQKREEEKKNVSDTETEDTTYPKIIRPQVPDDEEIAGNSVFDDEITVITKGVGDALVEIKVSVPEKFHLKHTIVVDISNDSTGDIYELGAYYENGYIAKMNIPVGEYTVINAMVVYDYNGQFSIPTGQTFSVDEDDNSTHTINLTLSKGVASSKKEDGYEKKQQEEDTADKIANMSEKVSGASKRMNVGLYLVVGGILLLLTIGVVIASVHNKRSGKRKNSVF